jgi:hypothetical protein
MQHPMCRATIRDGSLTLNSWAPDLFRSVDAPQGTVLADLTALSPGELLVEWVGGGEAADAVLAWARLVGYTRVWLPDDVVDFEDTLVALAEAEVECPTCGMCWANSSPDFWATVRRSGYFPPTCPACNGSLPEWGFAEPAVRSVEDTSTQ